MIRIKKYSDLSNATREKLNLLIYTEFGHIPIVNETQWAVPDWTIINYVNQKIATFYNIVVRDVYIDDIKYSCSGINNVITPGEFRGKGYASKTLHDTENFMFDDLNCEIGILLCANELIPFYERLNWRKIDCPVQYNQISGQKLWEANTMILTRKKNIKPQLIDLNGKPW